MDESDQTFTQTSLPPANLSNLSHQEDPNQVSSLQLSNDPSFSSQIQIPAIMAIIACVFAVLLSIGLFTIMRLRKRREFLAIKKSFGRDVEDQIGEKEDKISQYLPGRSGGVLKLYQGLPVEDKNVHVFNYPILDQVSMV